MNKDPSIEIRDLKLQFRIYTNKAPALKEVLVGMVRTKGQVPKVVKFDALKNVSLSICSGERVGIMGLNGAGKSTLLRTIAGIYPPYSGDLEVTGSLTALIELGTGFDHDLSGRENIYLNGTMLRRSFRQMKQLESEIVEFAELEEFIDLPVKYYSSGMVARLAFSIATVVPTEILLLDELFATGDAKFRLKATKRMNELIDKSQILVLVSHDPANIRSTCNRAIVLNKGQILFDGQVEDAISYYEQNIVAESAPVVAPPAPAPAIPTAPV